MFNQYSALGNPSKKPQKPNALLQKKVIEACTPLITELKKQITPLPDPLRWNHVVDIYGKWYRNQYHIYLKYQCPPNSLSETFDSGLARLGWTGQDTFILSAYMAHRKKWEAFYEDIPLKEALVQIKESHFFSY